MATGHSRPCTPAAMTIAVRQTDNARHHLIGRKQLSLYRPHTALYCHHPPRLPALFGDISRVHQQLAPWLALHQSLVIVHPGIVVSNMSATDESIVLPGLRHLAVETVDVLQHFRHRETNALVWRLQSLRARWLKGAKINARWVLL